MISQAELLSRLRAITTVVLDVDGVLTDGGIFIGPGGAEWKRFDVQDGSGIVYLRRAGLRVAIISGRTAEVVDVRARELEVSDVYQGYKWKLDALHALAAKYGLRGEQICCLGDDLPDLPLMGAVGVSIAVANARPEVQKVAHYVTQARGGAGAVREAAELILRAQGKWNMILSRYLFAVPAVGGDTHNGVCAERDPLAPT